jgi:hypothetical protein
MVCGSMVTLSVYAVSSVWRDEEGSFYEEVVLASSIGNPRDRFVTPKSPEAIMGSAVGMARPRNISISTAISTLHLVLSTRLIHT